MIDAKGPYRIGALFVALSGIVHILGVLVSGFASGSQVLLPGGILYLGFAYGLLQGWRSLAYLVFVVMMAGSVVALTSAWSTPGVPTWIFLSIFVLDWLTVFALFGALWKARPVAA
jgi:hypothetical protein